MQPIEPNCYMVFHLSNIFRGIYNGFNLYLDIEHSNYNFNVFLHGIDICFYA